MRIDKNNIVEGSLEFSGHITAELTSDAHKYLMDLFTSREASEQGVFKEFGYIGRVRVTGYSVFWSCGTNFAEFELQGFLDKD